MPVNYALIIVLIFIAINMGENKIAFYLTLHNISEYYNFRSGFDSKFWMSSRFQMRHVMQKVIFFMLIILKTYNLIQIIDLYRKLKI